MLVKCILKYDQDNDIFTHHQTDECDDNKVFTFKNSSVVNIKTYNLFV